MWPEALSIRGSPRRRKALLQTQGTKRGRGRVTCALQENHGKPLSEGGLTLPEYLEAYTRPEKAPAGPKAISKHETTPGDTNLR